MTHHRSRLSCWDRIWLDSNRYSDAALWINLAAGLGMALFHATDIGPFWVGGLIAWIAGTLIGGAVIATKEDEASS